MKTDKHGTVEDYYDSVTDDNIDITNTEIKVNPNFYIHIALVNAQKALLKDDIKIGFLQYRVIVEYVENIANAANLLDNDYKEELKKFKEKEEYKQSAEQGVMLAHKKLNLITKAVFSNTVSTQAGKL